MINEKDVKINGIYQLEQDGTTIDVVICKIVDDWLVYFKAFYKGNVTEWNYFTSLKEFSSLATLKEVAKND